MADTIRKIDYFSMAISNRPGAALRVLDTLRDAGVNLLAFTGFPNGRQAQIDLIPERTPALTKVARSAGLKLSVKKTGFLVQGQDRPGAVASVLEKLTAEKINVTAIDAACAGAGRYSALLWVKPAMVRKAAKVLHVKK
jgi:hypothetical protein